jgi:hypothetical protein
MISSVCIVHALEKGGGDMMYGDPHGKMTSKVFGGILVIVGILWWLTNYGVLDAAFWDWLLPLLVILLGLWKISMCWHNDKKYKEGEEHKM